MVPGGYRGSTAVMVIFGQFWQYMLVGWHGGTWFEAFYIYISIDYRLREETEIINIMRYDNLRPEIHYFSCYKKNQTRASMRSRCKFQTAIFYL